jgi:ABC-2 type transport system permease protein
VSTTTAPYSSKVPSRIPSSRSREVLALLVRRDLAVKYQDSSLGYLWSLLEPLGLALTYWFVFGVLYGESNPSAPLHVVVGIFAWMWANTAISESTKSLVSQSTLITTIKAPRAIFPIGRVVARFAEYLAGLPIVVVFAFFFDGRFDWHLMLMIPAIIMQFTLLTGLSLALASINVIYRDVERMMRVILRVLFYMAPIVYPLTKITGSAKHKSNLPMWAIHLYECNPFVGIFQLYHTAWERNQKIHLDLVAVSSAGCIVLFFVGWWTFHKLEATVLKEL